MLQKLLIVVMFLNLLTYNHAYGGQPPSGTAQGQKPANSAAPVAVEKPRSSALQKGSTPDQTEHEPKSVRVILPGKDKYDYISFGAALLLTLVGIVGVGVGICTLIYLRKQAAEMRLQRKVMVRSLRAMREQGKEKTKRSFCNTAPKSSSAFRVPANSTLQPLVDQPLPKSGSPSSIQGDRLPI